jgi:hypothetical protein
MQLPHLADLCSLPSTSEMKAVLPLRTVSCCDSLSEDDVTN